MKKIFKKGDFVRIKEGTHDNNMPKSRMGHLIARPHAAVRYSDAVPRHETVWEVFMTNGIKLKFHEMYMEHVE
mgnify:CR=1 FL=1|jgi:hypothetical protein